MVIDRVLQSLHLSDKFRFEVWAMLDRLRFILLRLLVVFGFNCCRLLLAIVGVFFVLPTVPISIFIAPSMPCQPMGLHT